MVAPPFSRIFLGIFVSLAAAACSAAAPDPDHGDYGETSDELSSGPCRISRDQILGSVGGGRRQAIERAFTWWDAKVPYSQSRSHGGYRTDCSGFVSMCWELGQSYTTADFYNGGGQSFRLSGFGDLLPGDALVHRSGGSGHIVLFLGWNDASQSSACVIEEANTAADMKFGSTSASSFRSGGYKAIRANKLRDETAADPDPAPSSGDDVPLPTPRPSGADPAPAPDPDPGGGGAECVGDGDCNPGNNGSGLICESGMCVPGCHIDAQCPGYSFCVSGQCM